MARKYTREELRERLRRSVYKVVTEDGIEGVTAVSYTHLTLPTNSRV